MAELKRRKQAEAKLAEWKHLANHRSPVDLSRLKERIKTLEAELAEVKAERDKYLAAYSEVFDQRDEYAAECKRLWPIEEQAADAERRGAVAALREAADDPALRLSGHSGISITRLRARALRLEKD